MTFTFTRVTLLPLSIKVEGKMINRTDTARPTEESEQEQVCDRFFSFSTISERG